MVMAVWNMQICGFTVSVEVVLIILSTAILVLGFHFYDTEALIFLLQVLSRANREHDNFENQCTFIMQNNFSCQVPNPKLYELKSSFRPIRYHPLAKIHQR